MSDNGVVAVLSPVQIADDIINAVLDEIFPAEKAASDIISALLDRVMTIVKRPGVFYSYCVVSPRVGIWLHLLVNQSISQSISNSYKCL